MADITPRDRTFLTNLYNQGYDETKAYTLLNKARKENNLPEIKQSGKVGEFFTGIGKGLYGVASQVSRLAPGDQSADPTSFFSRSQRDMKGADVERRLAGQNPESFTSKAGEFVGETLPTALVSGGAGTLAKGIAGLGIKAGLKGASKALPFLTAPGKGATFGQIAKFGAVEGAKDVAAYDLLTKGKTSAGSIAMGAVAGPVLGMGIKGIANLPGYAGKLSNQINKSKVGAYTENVVDTGKKFVSGLGDVAETIATGVSRIPSNIKTNVAEKRIQQEAIKSLKTTAQKVAASDGVDIADVKIIPQIVGKVKPQARKLFDAVKKFELDPRSTNPIEIIGKPIVTKLKQLNTQASQLGSKLDTIAKSLKGKPVKRTKEVLNTVKNTLDNEGITVVDGNLNLTGSQLEGLGGNEKIVQNVYKRLVEATDASDYHRLKKYIDSNVEFGKTSEGLTGGAERLLKTWRKTIDDALDSQFTNYKVTNQELANRLQPIQEMRRFMKTLPDATEDVLDMQAGLLARRLTGNAQSNPQIRNILKMLDKATGKTGTKESVEALQDLYNILDKYYSIAGKTGFQGQVTSGITGGIKSTIMDSAKQFAGKSEAVVKKALDDLLEESLKTLKTNADVIKATR